MYYCQVAYAYSLKYSFSLSQLPVWKKEINYVNWKGRLFRFESEPSTFCSFGKWTNMLTKSNKYIRITFGNCFMILRILRKTEHLMKNLLLWWMRKVQFLAIFVVFCRCANYSFIDGLLIFQERKYHRKTRH